MCVHHGVTWREKHLRPGVQASEVEQKRQEKSAGPIFLVKMVTKHADSDPVRRRTAKEVDPTR
jgi:hypothetical protein